VGATAVKGVEDGLEDHVTQFEGPLESLLFLAVDDQGAEFVLLDALRAWLMQHPDQVLIRHYRLELEITSKQGRAGECKADQQPSSQEATIACETGDHGLTP
jgi:DNA-binding transcriptional LysR family regulator